MYLVNDKEYECAIDISQDIFNDSWKLKIIWHLLNGEKRYKDLHAEVNDITKKTLTIKLRDLEAKQLIKRESFPEIPPRVVYSLTPIGEKLRPILGPMFEWGIEYAKECGKCTEDNVESDFTSK